MRFADDRRNASSIMSSSIRFESTGGQVGCTTKQSWPLTFSSIWKLNSPSENLDVLAWPISISRYWQISSASGRFALPEKTLMFTTPPQQVAGCKLQVDRDLPPPADHEPPVYASGSSEPGYPQRKMPGWGGRIRTFGWRI